MTQPQPPQPSSTSSSPPIPRTTHLHHLQHTLTLAHHSPPQPTNFRVGCVIVAYPPNDSSTGTVLSTGYTLELPGNTHAEQCALAKLSGHSERRFVVLYTSLEPCGKRLSGARACVARILATRGAANARGAATEKGATKGEGEANTPTQEATGEGNGVRIDKVVFGAKEPGTFVRDSQSCRLMSEGGLEWEYLPDFEGEILRVAMEGHRDRAEAGTGQAVDGKRPTKETRIDDISPEERKRQEALPRNPKKRMMEGPPPGSAPG